MPLSIGVALAVAASLTGSGSPASVSAQAPMQQVQTVQQTVETYFADAPIMISIARCESHFRQYDKDDGSVYRGVVNNKDVGVMQINEYYHADTAKKLGFDLYSVQGNMEYARYLYEKEGTTPWNSSSPCWGKDASKFAKNKTLALAK